MMKKFLFPGLFIVICFNACDVLHESEQREKRKAVNSPEQRITKQEPVADKATLYTKLYKFKTGQSYTRAVERYYFGPHAAMLNALNKYDIKRGFNIEHYTKYSKASFFQTDVYEIPANMKSKAVEQFKPLIDSIFQHTVKHKNFHAEILVMGYTDESPIPYNAPIYNQLLTMTQQKYFNYNDYYNALSFYRAKEVSDIISVLLSDKKNMFDQYDQFTFDIIAEGRGIEFPDAKRSYDLQDDKRKITKVYWKVIR